MDNFNQIGFTQTSPALDNTLTKVMRRVYLKMFLAFQRVIHSGSRKAIELSDVDELIREIIKEKTENGIKKETGYRNERYFTERNGNP